MLLHISLLMFNLVAFIKKRTEENLFSLINDIIYAVFPVKFFIILKGGVGGIYNFTLHKQIDFLTGRINL